jgi:hypothetical protein
MRHLGWASAALAAATITLAGQAWANVVINIDKSTQRMSVVVDGVPRWNWRVSTGAPGYDTPSGTFRAFRMEASHFSKQFDDAPMPHSIFFTRRGHAVHGYLNTSHLGLPVSHGCVRLDPQNATALYALVKQQGVLNTTVVVTGHIPNAAVARRRAPDDQRAEAEQQPAYRPASPSYGENYGNNYSNNYYSRDDRYYTSRDDRYYSGPPTPPPGYPAYPRAGGFPFGD